MPKVGLHKKFNYFLLGQFEEREKLTWKEPLDEEEACQRHVWVKSSTIFAEFTVY